MLLDPVPQRAVQPTALFDVANAVALVTGGTRGIGRAIAHGLCDAGARVVFTGRDAAALHGSANLVEHGMPMFGQCWDAAEPSSAEQLIERVLTDHGRLDILVNNAGMIERSPAERHTLQSWDQVIATNLTGAFALATAAGRVMLEQGCGRIVNIASVLAFSGGQAVAAYAASKAGLVQLTRSLAAEWSGRGVTINAIAAGYVETDLTAPLQADPTRYAGLLSRIPAGRFGKAAELVGPTIFLCSPAASYVTGAVLAVDGGWLAT